MSDRTFIASVARIATGGLVALGLTAGAALAQNAVLSPAITTKAFLDVALSTGNFIDEAGRIALAAEAGRPVQKFARAAVFDQSDARDRIAPWTDATQPIVTGRSAMVASDLPGPLADLSAGLATLTGVKRIADETMARTEGGVIVTAEERALLEQLQNQAGAHFDRTYVASQKNAYATLAKIYDAYAREGDDPALRAAAARELPIVRRQAKLLETL